MVEDLRELAPGVFEGAMPPSEVITGAAHAGEGAAPSGLLEFLEGIAASPAGIPSTELAARCGIRGPQGLAAAMRVWRPALKRYGFDLDALAEQRRIRQVSTWIPLPQIHDAIAAVRGRHAEAS